MVEEGQSKEGGDDIMSMARHINGCIRLLWRKKMEFAINNKEKIEAFQKDIEWNIIRKWGMRI